MTARLLSLQDIATARQYYAAGYWRAETLYDRLVHWANVRPGARALSDDAGDLTYGRLLQWVDAFAGQLADAGLRPGDRVAYWAPSRMESAACLLACSRMGYVCVPSLHRDHTVASVMAILERTRAAALVVQDRYGVDSAVRNISSEAAALPHMRHVTVLEALNGERNADVARFGGLRPAVAPAPASNAGNPDRISYLAFTSGTTGTPKGVMHSDNTILSNGRAVARDMQLGPESVIYTLSPMSHNMGTVSLATTLACGGALAVCSSWNPDRAIQRIEATGATYLVGVPTHGIDILSKLPTERKLGNVRSFQLAGAPVPRRLAHSLIERGIAVQNCYGMTENCSFLYTRLDDGEDIVTQSCGRCCDGMEIAILDAEDGGRRLPAGEVGEIGIRGSSMMLGYFDDQIATEAAYNRAGWFRSGDLGLVGADGNVRIMGRKKDLIIRGGRNIQPAMIEDLATRHAAISKAAAFPVPDERLGETVCLAIMTGDVPQPPQAEDVLSHLAAMGLSRYDMPEHFIVLDEFPLTASGKILKRELAAMAADGRIRPRPVRRNADKANTRA